MTDSLTQTQEVNTTMDVPRSQKTYIRPYKESEIPHIRDRIMTEVPKLPHYQGVNVDADRVTQVLRDGLKSQEMFNAWMLVNENEEIVGGGCGYCVTQLLSWDKITGDIFLYVEPEYRCIQNVVKIMLAYRDWGVARGATIIAATQTGGYKQEQLGKLMERFAGYVPVGTIYYYWPKGNPEFQRTHRL